MTATLGADANGDLYLDAGGDLALLSGIDAIAQTCTEVARTRLGELVLQTDEGLPFFEAVFTGQPNVATFETALRAALSAVDGVAAVTSLVINQDGARLNYSAEITTDIGDVVTIDG